MWKSSSRCALHLSRGQVAGQGRALSLWGPFEYPRLGKSAKTQVERAAQASWLTGPPSPQGEGRGGGRIVESALALC